MLVRGAGVLSRLARPGLERAHESGCGVGGAYVSGPPACRRIVEQRLAVAALGVVGATGHDDSGADDDIDHGSSFFQHLRMHRYRLEHQPFGLHRPPVEAIRGESRQVKVGAARE